MHGDTGNELLRKAVLAQAKAAKARGNTEAAKVLLAKYVEIRNAQARREAARAKLLARRK